MRQWLPAARLTGWILLLVATIAVFGAVGPAPPPVFAPDRWSDWAMGRGGAEMAFGMLRVVVIALAWYLLGATAIGAAARVLRIGRLVHIADLMTVPPVRRLLQAALGIGLATASLSAVGQGAARFDGAAPVAAAHAAEDGEAVAEDAPVLRMMPDDPVPAVIPIEDDPAPQPSAFGADDIPGDGEPWTVEHGQHFWGIAHGALEQAWGRAPSDAEVLGYWQRLIEHNRQHLADPENPDLIFPGQVFHLPPAPDAPEP